MATRSCTHPDHLQRVHLLSFNKSYNYNAVSSSVEKTARAPAGMGKGGGLALPWKSCKVFLYCKCRQVSVDEVFMHYLQYMSSTATGASPQDPHQGSVLNPAGKLPSSSPFNLPTPGKNPAGAHGNKKCWTYRYQIKSNQMYL